MQFTEETLARIERGEIDMAFRRWAKPGVRVGAVVNTPIGALGVDAVEQLEAAAVTLRDAERAGYASIDALHMDLDARDGALYRIRFHRQQIDPRARGQNSALSAEDITELNAHLAKIDRSDAWARKALTVIGQQAGAPAADVAAALGRETAKLKTDMRRLKALGLTENWAAGYRLTPRGTAFVEAAGR